MNMIKLHELNALMTVHPSFGHVAKLPTTRPDLMYWVCSETTPVAEDTELVFMAVPEQGSDIKPIEPAEGTFKMLNPWIKVSNESAGEVPVSVLDAVSSCPFPDDVRNDLEKMGEQLKADAKVLEEEAKVLAEESKEHAEEADTLSYFERIMAEQEKAKGKSTYEKTTSLRQRKGTPKWMMPAIVVAILAVIVWTVTQPRIKPADKVTGGNPLKALETVQLKDLSVMVIETNTKRVTTFSGETKEVTQLTLFVGGKTILAPIGATEADVFAAIKHILKHGSL
jgi:hypothetical protein